MRRLLAVNVVVALLVLMAVGCESSAFSENRRPGVVHHVVLCWLKDPGNTLHIDKIVDQTYEYSPLPGIVSVAAGASLASSRPVVDDSFDVGIVMTFASSEALAAYLDDPKHQRATEEVLRPLVERLVIYDIREDR